MALVLPARADFDKRELYTLWLNIVLLAWQARLHSSPHVAGSKGAPLTGNESNHVGTPDEMNYEINFCYKNYSDVIPFRNLHGIRHN